ncbi:hypothetical protein ASZ90_004700 [hydrocarbon metagenome]|uniref:Uncharacterized protein n=1 Tax=hydrocarbon metagenome TaxID=938273 RepID=A0A0W8FXG6_9ZZZZ
MSQKNIEPKRTAKDWYKDLAVLFSPFILMIILYLLFFT